ncbi:MAG: ATP-binding protein, partial [Thermodesulfobacteriota bacterium]
DLCATRGDEGNIEQVIMNLAVNARDAMPNGGKLTIKSERVTIDDDYCRRYSYATPGRYIRMTIADTGTGMSEETQQRIFEPFFTTKGVGRGTGLGLAVVYGIIRKHEGWVNVESRVGRGTTFTVYLPAHLETVETVDEEAVSLEEYCGNGERILLVEDEAVVCEYGATALEENGYRVVVAGSAEEALASFIKERDNIDLLFTDVVLADYDGVQLVNELTSLRPDLKVLLSSGYTDEKSKWSVIEERGYSFLQKPYSIAALLKTVSDTLRR